MTTNIHENASAPAYITVYDHPHDPQDVLVLCENLTLARLSKELICNEYANVIYTLASENHYFESAFDDDCELVPYARVYPDGRVVYAKHDDTPELLERIRESDEANADIVYANEYDYTEFDHDDDV